MLFREDGARLIVVRLVCGVIVADDDERALVEPHAEFVNVKRTEADGP